MNNSFWKKNLIFEFNYPSAVITTLFNFSDLLINE